MERYNQEFQIYFRDVDISGCLTMNTMVDFMQEVARNHATQLGVAYSHIGDPYYWLILRTKIQLDRAAKVGETIRIETFIEGLDGLYSVRRFNFYSKQNVMFGYIQGYYLLMNGESHRPVKLKTLEGKEALFSYRYEGARLKKLSEHIVAQEKVERRRVWSSDIDTNSHMNNAHYIRWIMDMFTVQERAKCKITSIQIQYMKEVKEGQEVELIRGTDEQGVYQVLGKSTTGEIYFISSMEVIPAI